MEGLIVMIIVFVVSSLARNFSSAQKNRPGQQNRPGQPGQPAQPAAKPPVITRAPLAPAAGKPAPRAMPNPARASAAGPASASRPQVLTDFQRAAAKTAPAPRQELKSSLVEMDKEPARDIMEAPEYKSAEGAVSTEGGCTIPHEPLNDIAAPVRRKAAFNASEMRRAVIMSEILEKPVSLRKRKVV